LSAAAAVSLVEGRAMNGTNAGGWMYNEAWITPTLFYRFLGKKEGHSAYDPKSICAALGPVEGNKLMRAHWDAWYTEDHFVQMSKRGVEIIRLPIGDWTLTQYDHYVGCMDGAPEKIDWFMDMAQKYNIKVWVDIHWIKDSINGFVSEVWTDDDHFGKADHGDWWGTWHEDTKTYDPLNWDNYNRGLTMIEGILKKWGTHPAFYAFEPINEPQRSPVISMLKSWY